jgi:AAA lid domain
MATKTSTPGQLPSDHGLWQALTTLVGLSAITGRIVGESPQSLMIVGPAGNGKSALLNRFRLPHGEEYHNSNLWYLTSASSTGITSVLQNKAVRVTHLVAPEFQTFILRKGSVWASLLGMLLPAMAEGLHEVRNGPKMIHLGGAKLGLLAAMTYEAYQWHREQLRGTGFFDRMLVVHWHRSRDDQTLAQYLVNRGETRELTPVSLNIPEDPIAIHCSARLADRITKHAAARTGSSVARGSVRLIALAKALAWTQGADEVSERHVDALFRFSVFWRAENGD